MSDRYAAVADASALLSYLDGDPAVGELLLELEDEGRILAVPSTCLAAAYARSPGAYTRSLLIVLASLPAVSIVSPDGVEDLIGIGARAHAADGDLAVGQAAYVAITNAAYYVTADPKRAERALPEGWAVLDVRG